MQPITPEDLRTELVTVLVGPKEAELKVHEAIIRRIPFFDKALSGSFLEGHTRTVPLPEDEQSVVLGCIRWLYSGCPDELEDRNTNILPYGNDAKGCDAHLPHGKLWILADKLLCPKLQNATLRTMFAHHSKSALKSKGQVNYRGFSELVSKLAIDSPLARFLIRVTLWDITQKEIKKDIQPPPLAKILEIVANLDFSDAIAVGLKQLVDDPKRATASYGKPEDYLVDE